MRDLILAGVSLSLILGGCAANAPVDRQAAQTLVYVSLQSDAGEQLMQAADKLGRQSTRVDFTFDAEAAGAADLRLELEFDMREVPLSDAEGIWLMTAGAYLLTLYPSICAEREYSVRATVFEPGGERIGYYELADSRKSWLWMFQGSGCEAATSEQSASAYTGLFKQVYRKMADDGLFTSAAARSASIGGPLVYLSASTAQDIVDRVTRMEQPFARYTFDPAYESEADYSIHLDFAFAGGDMGIGRAMFAIMTIGVVSGCHASRMTLNAQISDRERQPVKAYSLSRRVRTEMLTRDCVAHDQYSRPDVVAELVKELFRRVERDRLPILARSEAAKR